MRAKLPAALLTPDRKKILWAYIRYHFANQRWAFQKNYGERYNLEVARRSGAIEHQVSRMVS